MKENLSISTSDRNGMLEVTALGLGGIGLFLFMFGVEDTRLAQEFLKYPEQLHHPYAAQYLEELLSRGVREIAYSVGPLSGATIAAINRLIKK